MDFHSLQDYFQANNLELYSMFRRHGELFCPFHNESHHPHCHIIAYSIGKEPYITQERLLKLKTAFGSEMFRNERMQAFQEQTKYRDQLAEETRQLVSRIVDEINTGVYQNETVALMLQSLSEYVQRAKGKKQYKNCLHSNSWQWIYSCMQGIKRRWF